MEYDEPGWPGTDGVEPPDGTEEPDWTDTVDLGADQDGDFGPDLTTDDDVAPVDGIEPPDTPDAELTGDLSADPAGGDPTPDLTTTDGIDLVDSADPDEAEVPDDPDGDDPADESADTDDTAYEPPSLVGADPDLPAVDLDDAGVEPIAVDIADLAPVDGPPWADPDLLGPSPETDTDLAPATPDGALSDLYGQWAEPPGDAGPESQWTRLATAEDPAVRGLARFWGPV